MKPKIRDHNSSLINRAFKESHFIEDTFSIEIIQQCVIHPIKSPSPGFQLSIPVSNNANNLVQSLKDINYKLRPELSRFPIARDITQPSKSQYPKLKGKNLSFFSTKVFALLKAAHQKSLPITEV